MRNAGQERRSQQRFQKRCAVDFTADGEKYTGICRNLSLDGLFIKTRKPLSLAKIVEMILHLPDGTVARLTGFVARATREPHSRILEQAGILSKDGMGIRLVEKDANYLNFVTSLAGSS